MTGTERKVFQKYYPPDFDPRKLKKERGKKKNFQFVQRVMAPFNMQCNTCNEYIYKGKKFNMRRETAMGESYLGLKIFRFYFRCPNCLAEISFKTDIENVDYSAEHGATRLFEAFKYYQAQEKRKEEKEEAEKNDAMKMLEKRTKMSRAEMEALGKLEKLQEVSKKLQGTDVLSYLADVQNDQKLSLAEQLRKQEEADEEEISRLMRKRKPVDEDLNDEIVDDDEQSAGTSTSANATTSKSLYKAMQLTRPIEKPKSFLSGVIVKKKSVLLSDPVKPTMPSSSLAGIADYGSDSNSDGD